MYRLVMRRIATENVGSSVLGKVIFCVLITGEGFVATKLQTVVREMPG